MFLPNITTVLVNKDEIKEHEAASYKNGWKLKQIDQHATESNILLATYVKINY